MILPKKRSNSECAEAKTNQPIEELRILTISIGLLPILSESAPRTGVLKNENSANTENSIVMVLGLAPNEYTYVGIVGMIIPRPITSINTVNRIISFSFDIGTEYSVLSANFH